MDDTPPVCDYEGSDYRTRFWEGQGRSYEDQVERVALRRLMPPAGQTLIEIGAGFGRLADEYRGYRQVILFDYSRSLLREAQAQLPQLAAPDTQFIFVAGNWYKMPFAAGLFDTMVQIRTLHHAADVPALMQQLARIARPGGRYVLEFANKQNLKAILRYSLRRQDWSPFAPEPVEFTALNFDFHPHWIRQQLQQAGFHPGRVLSVSHFRLGVLKKAVPNGWLVWADSLLQATGGWWQLTPSIFTASAHPEAGESARPGSFFACPECGTPLNHILPGPQNTRLTCSACELQWGVTDGLYDFKEPLK